MSRDIPAALEEAIEKPVVRPFYAVFIGLPDPVRAWTGVGTLIFDDAASVSRTWTGAGAVGASDTIEESTDGGATGIKVALYNVPSEFRDDIADQATKGATFEVYIGALNETMQQVEAAKLLWRGRVDEYKITDAGDSITVEISGESRGIDQRRPAIKKFTREAHRRNHPTDAFFDYVSQMTEISILWAAASQNSASVGGGAGYTGGGGGTTSGPQISNL